VEYVPEEMKNNGAEVIHLATGFVVGYPPCPYIRDFKAFIETQFGLEVVVGTHPIPLKYLKTHDKLPFWDETDMRAVAGELLDEERQVMEAYN
jgi:hypothetical protein